MMNGRESWWPRWRTVAGFVGSAALGLLVGDLNGLGIDAQGGLVAAAVLMVAAYGVRRLPPAAPLQRYVARFCWTAATVTMVAAALFPGPVALLLVATTVVLTSCAIILSTQLKAAVALLSRAALVGGGAAFIGDGTSLLVHRQVAVGMGLVALGGALAGTGLVLLTKRWMLLRPAAVIGLGTAFLVLGLTLPAGTPTVTSVALIGAGVAFLLDGAGLVIDQGVLWFVAVISSGAAAAGVGLMLLNSGRMLVGGVVIWLGVTVIATAMAMLTDRPALTYLAVLMNGVATIAVGAAWHSEQQALVTVMIIATGVVVVGFATAAPGLAIERAAAGRLFHSLITAPTSDDDGLETDPVRQEDGTAP